VYTRYAASQLRPDWLILHSFLTVLVMLDTKLLQHIHASPLALSEMVQACCTLAREQLEGVWMCGTSEVVDSWGMAET
jgi:hypothetical protein